MVYSLQSLITILQQILNPEETRWFVTDNKPQLESLLQKAASLMQNLENYSGPKVESLESRIRDAAEKAEDVIESHMVNQMLSSPGEVVFTFSTSDLQQVLEEFDSIIQGKMKMSTDSSLSFLADHLSSKNILVGVDEDLMQLKDHLTGQESKLEIVPIVGMGGIGKTRLARSLFEDRLIVSHFDVCAWTTVSQDYNVRALLLGLLCRPNEKISYQLTQSTDNELKDILYKRLYDRRYLVVLDDMWSTDAWDVIRRCFPNNHNGSRIVLTTRESEVAKYVGAQSLQHKVQLMNKSNSWNLLHQIVFGGEDCPDSLEGIGRKIASDCGGLPLAINVIGGVLSKAKRSREVWEHVANDVRVAIAETDDDLFSNVLCLSYNHLPNHLKPCFLYMGAFPEDYVSEVSRLIPMWVAEGFLKSNGDKSLEEKAQDSLEALVERNLVLVTRKKSNGKPMCYGMHDLLRDLCRRKGGEEKFVDVMNERVEVAMALHKVRRVSVHTSLPDGMEEELLMPLARSFICPDGDMSPEILSPVFSLLRLLRVLDVLDMQFQEFPMEVLQLVNLRYLAFSCSSESDIPREISRLLNLQTLIAKINEGNVPGEIWEMSELRHLKLDTAIYIEKGGFCMKQNMQRISWLVCSPSVIRMGFLKSIPNIRNLAIMMDHLIVEWNEVVDLSHLHKLQTLRCVSVLEGDIRRYLPILRFPPSLRKLNLFECLIFARDWTTLCALPNLEVLKICECVFEKEVFELEDDVFRSLQYLHMGPLKNLVRWTADDTNFPRLRELILIDCPLLDEIPGGIGDISTLQCIAVNKCRPSLEASAKQIQEVQQSEFDNYDLKVRIYQ